MPLLKVEEVDRIILNFLLGVGDSKLFPLNRPAGLGDLLAFLIGTGIPDLLLLLVVDLVLLDLA